MTRARAVLTLASAAALSALAPAAHAAAPDATPETSPPLAAVPEHRVAVVIGNDTGDPGEPTLEYAERDAERMRDLLVEAGGVEPERMALVRGGTAKEARRALAEAVGRVAELRRLGATALIVYVSAHADEAALHLGGERLPLAELEETLHAAKATLRLAIIDACRGSVRTKGGRPVAEVALSFGAASTVEGEVTISAASPGEPAQEWSGLGGSLFTHHLLAALRGVADADADGRVSLSEAYAYAFRRTVAYSTSGPAPQHPSFSVMTRGFGEWTFTRPAELGAALVLAPDLGGPVWVTDLRRRELVAELAKGEGEALRLSVRPGWYRVVRPAGAFSEVADLNLAWGGERTVHGRDLVRTAAARATLRGGAPLDLRPWRVALGYRFSTGLVRGALEHAGEVQLARAWGAWLGRVRVGAGASRFTAGTSEVEQLAIELGLGAGTTFVLGPAELGLGLEVSSAWARQRFARSDGTSAEAPRSDLVPGASAFAALSLPLTDAWWIGAELAPGLRWPLLYDGSRETRAALDVRALVARAF